MPYYVGLHENILEKVVYCYLVWRRFKLSLKVSMESETYNVKISSSQLCLKDVWYNLGVSGRYISRTKKRPDFASWEPSYNRALNLEDLKKFWLHVGDKN